MTEKSELQKAIECLAIRDVYLRESHITMHAKFDPVVRGKADIQLRIDPSRMDQVELFQESDSPSLTVIRIHVQTGARLVEEGVTEAQLADPENIGKYVKAEILATFIAEYEKTCEDLSPKALEEFARQNAPFHVWPYWREYLQSTTSRAKLPSFTLPMFSLRRQAEVSPAGNTERKTEH